nr:MAG TPA: hypothetical protein [Caudoviricetes sp.]
MYRHKHLIFNIKYKFIVAFVRKYKKIELI